MKYLVTADEAALVRWIVDHHGAAPAEALHSFRIFQPIYTAEASGRAACRIRGAKIERGETAIAFGFDPVAKGDSPGAWGKLQRGWIHRDVCPT